jgi:hypothetical protein
MNLFMPSAPLRQLVTTPPVRAPQGGIELSGEFYPGGTLIPFQVVQRANPTERRKLAGRYEFTAHAPAGGIDIAGQHFRGGQFIPSDVLAQATPEQKAAVMPAEKEPADADTIHPENSRGIPRAKMPQIHGKHVPEFLQGLKNKGIKVTEQRIPVGKLKSTQNELSRGQMDAILSKVDHGALAESAVMVSNDGHILDGHHRWGALRLKDPNTPIKANVIDLPIDELLREANGFDKVERKAPGKGKGLPPLEKLPPLPEPKDENDTAWLEQAMQHPYIKEAARRLEAEKSEGDTEDKWDKRPGSTKENPIWDPERVAKVHEPVIASFLNDNAKAAPGEKPRAVFLIGPFGAGKSFAGEPMARKIIPNHTLINPDEVKQRMPEDEGWNATHIHEESSHISKQVQKRAIENRHHVLFDGSGQNGEKMEKMANDLAAGGYDVHVIHVTVPKHISVHRAATRFLQNPFGMAKPGEKPSRYAPLGYVWNDVGSKPDETYRRLRDNPNIKSGLSVNTHRPFDQPVIEQDRFDRTKGQEPGALPGEKPGQKKASFKDPTLQKAADGAHAMAKEWQDKLQQHGVKVVLGGSLVSGLALPSDLHDADIRFLYDGDRKAIIPEIEKATGLKFRKSITVGGGQEPESDAHMIEGQLERNGVKYDVEGALRNTNYTGWANYYPQVMSESELEEARRKKQELKGDKKAYKAYKNSILEEVQKRVREKGLLKK